MLDFLYNLIINPLVKIIELFYNSIFSVSNNHIMSIILLSILINTLVLPLYLRADELQQIERDKQKSMEKWVKHISKAFKGDEKFFRLQAYYREQNYKPIYALKASISLLLQIPFFTAAYMFFTRTNMLDGVKAFGLGDITWSIHINDFYLINDLGKPDAIASIGNLSINMLPILMTLINIGSALVYTRGFSFKEKTRTLLLPILFLFILYNSPSGLVIYWTCNNLYSLIRNLFIKLIEKVKEIRKAKNIREIECAKIKPKFIQSKKIEINNDIRLSNFKMIAFIILFTLLLGCAIPLATVSVSISEFLDISNTPWYLLLNSLPTFFGLSLWIFVFYLFSNNNSKFVFSSVCIAIVLFFALNYFIFNKKFGSLTPDFVYIDNSVAYFSNEIIINLILFVIVLINVLIIFKYKRITYLLCISLIFALSILCIRDFVLISKGFKKETKIMTIDDIKPELELSKNNKNIILIMLDSASGPYMPYLLNLKPEIKEKFVGFTWYRNTITFGKHTLFGTPGIYGGYEYIPYESNKIEDKKLVTKMNEAISLLPTVLSNNNFKSFICDVAYADFKLKSDPEFFNKLNNTKGISLSEKFLNVAKTYQMGDAGKALRNRRCDRLFYYSLMKSVPFIFQEKVYNNGEYLCSKNVLLIYDNNFLSNFLELKCLSNLFNITTDNENKLIVIDNNTCHTDNGILPYPSFYPTYDYNDIADGHIELTDENGKKTTHTIDMGQFDPQVAALIQIGNFMDYLRKNNLYDNTKIVIVADHSFREKPFDIEDLVLSRPGYNKKKKYVRNLKKFMPLFLVKDFDSKSDFNISNEFMTNADTPTIILKDIVDNPINPFTGRVIDSSYKDNNNEFYLTCSGYYHPPNKVLKKNEYKYTIEDAPWLVVKKNIYNVSELRYDWSDFDPNFKE